MLNTYLAGTDIPIHLPGDDDNPTLFYIQPMTAESTSIWHALQELASKKATELLEDDTPESVTAQARARVDAQVSFLASRISRVENAPPDGGTLEGVTEITTYLRGLLFMQHNQLVAAFMDDNELRPLLFRPHPVPRAKSGAGQDRAGVAGKAGKPVRKA